MHSRSPLPLVDLPVRRLTRGDLVSCADLSEDRGWPRDEHRWGLLLSAGTGYGIAEPKGKGLVAACVVTSYGPRLGSSSACSSSPNATPGRGSPGGSCAM
ncbi:hypothetical protein SMICM304S_04858 [Streptomyces microflavus]